MEKSYSESYAAAGVDITAGYRSVELMKQYVARTMNEHCIGGLGGFGGLFELDCTGYKHPVLISGTDGVGTKLKIAMMNENPFINPPFDFGMVLYHSVLFYWCGDTSLLFKKNAVLL